MLRLKLLTFPFQGNILQVTEMYITLSLFQFLYDDEYPLMVVLVKNAYSPCCVRAYVVISQHFLKSAY